MVVPPWLTGAIGSRWLPPALLALILALDAAMRAGSFGVLVTGLLDEPAHASTALLVLLAIAGQPWLRRHVTFAVTAVLAAMLIDVDHIPLYLDVPHAADLGRPWTHTLTTALVLAVLWLVFRRRSAILAGAAAGVVLHFVRDSATGPGVALLWPLSRHVFLFPYPAYAALMTLVATVATARAWRITRLAAHEAQRP